MERHLFSMVMALAVWLAVAPVVQAQTVVEYIHTDALGTPVAVTNSAGAVIERSVYEPYGQLINRPLTDGPGFTGHVQDAATGLTYMQQRYYDPTIGRFLSVDPVTANSETGGNFNRYWYANNNPHKFLDPDGRAPCRNDNPSCDPMDDPVGQRECVLTCLGDTARPIGESKPHTLGSAIRANFRDNVDNSILGPGGKDAMHFLGDGIVDGISHTVDGSPGVALRSMVVGLVLKKLGPAGSKMDELVGEARKLYPGKAGKIERHHIEPKYLGGPKNGATADIDAAYHQVITNEFRSLWPYGGAKPSAQQVEEIMQKVYEKYPLP